MSIRDERTTRAGTSTIHTIGHSTHPFADFAAVLEAAGVNAIADVRRFPSSRRHPQYNRGELERALGARGIHYLWLGEALGGRRTEIQPIEQSSNRAWRVPAFRHYADAMATAPFVAALGELEAQASQRSTALLCAEKLWWKCHRRLLSDLLIVRGWRVVHLLELGRSAEHELSPWAKVDGPTITYPSLL
jgi:uncharacterized protein (DUF488 family)